MIEHELSDEKHFNAINERLEKVATKADIKELQEFLKTVKVGIGIFNVSGRTLMWIGGVIVALGIITGAWKGVLAWLGFSLIK